MREAAVVCPTQSAAAHSRRRHRAGAADRAVRRDRARLPVARQSLQRAGAVDHPDHAGAADDADHHDRGARPLDGRGADADLARASPSCRWRPDRCCSASAPALAGRRRPSASLNGWLVAILGIPPFVATLGTLGMAQGLSLIVSDGQSVVGIPHSVRDIYSATLLGMPVPIVIGARDLRCFPRPALSHPLRHLHLRARRQSRGAELCRPVADQAADRGLCDRRRRWPALPAC